MATRISTSISIGGKRTEHPPYIPCAATGKANSIFCPLGPSPTMGWFCMLKRHLDELDINAAHTIVWSEQIDVGVVGGGIFRTLTFPGLYIVKSERLFQGGVGDPNALHLVTFSDARHIAAKSSDTHVILSNLRSYANSAEFLTDTTTIGTWTALVEALWDACGVLGTYPGLPSGLLIDGAPNNHWLIGLNAYRALNAVLDQLDCALQHNPFSTNYGIVVLGAEQTLTSGTGDARLKWDGEPKSPRSSVASSVNVYHQLRYKSYGQERDTELQYNWAYNGTGQINSIDTVIEGAIGVVPLWDDLPVLLNELNEPSNTIEISARDINRASRYAIRWDIENHHRIYTGLLNDFAPAGQIKAVLWRNYGDGEDNALGGTVTEYVCCADLVTGCNSSSSGGGSEWAWLDGQLGSPERQQYLSPDYGRNTFPNYPRLPNIVQVWQASATASATVNPDATVEANGVKLHSGRVKRWVANGMATLDNCWILFIDDYDNKIGDIPAKQGDYYGPARLSGVTTVFGTTRPVYTVQKGGESGQEIVVFELYDTLNMAGTAAAKICYLNQATGAYATGNATTDEIVVRDFYRQFGEWSGLIGDQGIAKKATDNKYDIIWMERVSLINYHTSTAPFLSESQPIEVTTLASFQQGNKSPPANEVNDPNSMYPQAITGARVISVWNDRESRLDTLISQQIGLYAIATLAETMLSTDTDNIAIDDFTIKSVSPFNLTPDPLPDLTGTSNPFHLQGATGDDILLLWDNSTSKWMIVQTGSQSQTEFVVLSYTGSAPYHKADVVTPNLFNGKTIIGAPNDAVAGESCIIEFIDYPNGAFNNYPYVARTNKIYGPAKYCGEEGGLPVYRCAIGEQEWEAKSSSAVEQGEEGEFTLWYGGSATTITQAATCRYGAYVANKYAIVKCQEGELIANQIEC